MTSKLISSCFVFGNFQGLKLKFIKPKLVMSNIKDVSVGIHHMTLLGNAGEVFTLGSDYYYKHLTHEYSLNPVSVQLPKMVKVQSGEMFTASLTESGQVYTWGSNGEHSIWSRLGGRRHCLGRKKPDKLVQPLPIEFQEEILDIKCGRFHCLALGVNNLYSWGLNDYGQLGNTDLFGYNETPKPVSFFNKLNEKVVKIDAAEYSSAALTASGKVYTWGNNEKFNLSLNNHKKMVAEPTLVSLSLVKPIKDICIGSNTIMLIDENNEIFAGGMSFWSECKDFVLPVSSPPTEIACGTDYFAVLVADGTLVHYGGPFNPKTIHIEMPENVEIMLNGFVPGNICKLDGKYELVAAISNVPEDKLPDIK